jgi:hypothetical protein
VGYKFFVPSLAVFEIMSVFSLLELAANSLCLLINFCPIGDFFKPYPSRAKAGFKKSPSG